MSTNVGPSSSSSSSQPFLQRRRDARRKRDPHNEHPFKRLYIGPSPVSARSAGQVASAIAQDVQIENPVAISVIGAQGTITSSGSKLRRDSVDSAIVPSHLASDRRSSTDASSDVQKRSTSKKLSKQSLRSQSPPSPSTSPPRQTRDLSSLHIPRPTNGTRRRPSRTESTDGADRHSFMSNEEEARGILRSGRRQMSHSMVETGSLQQGQPHHEGDSSGVKFQIQDPRQRRQYSEGSALDGPSRAPDSVHGANRPILPLLDMSLDEEQHDSSVLHASPDKIKAQLSPRQDRLLRNAPSNRSMEAHSLQPKQSSSTIILHQKKSNEGMSPNANAYSYEAQHSDHPLTMQTEQTGDALTETGTLEQKRRSRMEEMRERARQRYLNSKVGQNVAFSSLRLPKDGKPAKQREHIRDASRQSRLSYVSAAGTQTSIGTRLTEGSFGATGGFRAKLIRSLKPQSQSQKNKTPTSQSVRAEARRHGRRSSSTRGGVVPGAVGTSSGGTKWVGQTFEVGKRLWETIENREVLLCGTDGHEMTLEAVREEEEGRRTSMSKKGKAGRTASELTSMTASPDDILMSFAREASDGREDALSASHDSLLAQATRINAGEPKRSATTSALDPSANGNLGISPKRPGARKTLTSRSTPSATSPSKAEAAGADANSLVRVQSAASLLTVPQDREVTSNWDIENRKGWNDVMSFISAQSNIPANIQRSARSAGDNFSEMGNKAKRAFDEQISDFRARQFANKHSRDRSRASGNDVSRTIIEESGSGAESGATTPTAFRKTPTSLTRKDILTQPEAPAVLNSKIAEATFELTRRPSFPGEIPKGEVNDAASDHQVAARPTFEEGSRENGDVALASTPSEAPSNPVDQPSSALRLPHMTSISEVGAQKKSVQFHRATSGTAPPLRSTTFDGENAPQKSLLDSGNEKLQLLGGRLRPAVRSGDAAPVPPEEVLSRNGTPDEKFGEQGHFGSAANEEVVTARSALRRDRMLVKVAWTPSEDVHKELTERESRKYDIHADPFREYMVVFRSGRLELWDDPSWTARVFGHADELKLRYVAPLRRGRAFVSLYSAIDSIFCVSFIADHHRSLFNLRKSGTHIWLFDARSISNGADWMWDLWREVGGEIPDAIDVHIPVMGTRVRIPIPEELPALTNQDGDSAQYGEGFKVITPLNVIRVVSELLQTFSQWAELCESAERRGIRFALAWRTHLQLNWIQFSDATDGSRRDWSVLVGSILCDSKAPSSLEFRTMSHYPSSVRTSQGIELQEPPAVEGFLWRVKAVSGALTRLYLSSHDGLLFINRSSRSFPPERFVASDPHLTAHQLKRSGVSASSLNDQRRPSGPMRRRRGSKSSPMSVAGVDVSANEAGTDVGNGGEETLQAMGRRVMEMLTLVPTSLEELDAQMEAFKAFEKRRMFEQITNSDGYINVCDIFLIKSLDEKGGVVRRPSSDTDGVEKIPKAKKRSNETGSPLHDDEAEEETEDEEEEEDVGGEEGYELAKDRAALRRARQFDVVLANGRSIRFEAYSKSVAREWINRVGDLARYWKRREKVDALEKMNASGYDPRLIQRKVNVRQEPRPLEQAADSERLAPLLGNVWNWCILDGCRTILRSGRLFTKKKPYTAFASRYCVLVSGRLLTYRLMTSTRTARARQNAGIFHKRQETVIHLRDSYVYSGKLTDHMLLNGRSDGAGAISSFGGGTGGAATSSTRHTLPRVYADGLLSIDEDEECTFVIRYRPQRVNRSADPQISIDSDMLSSEYPDARASTTKKQGGMTTLRDSTINVVAMRARSKLERDLWVWAINAERERIVREDKQRESKIRQNGKTPYRAHHS